MSFAVHALAKSGEDIEIKSTSRYSRYIYRSEDDQRLVCVVVQTWI